MSTTTATTRADSTYKTWLVPNDEFIPPKDVQIPPSLAEVPINPKGPTEIPLKVSQSNNLSNYRYKDFLPYNTLTSEPEIQPDDKYVDAASRADPEKKALFNAVPWKRDITPSIGTEVKGIQLSKLTNQQKDELALWAAERGVLVFRDQDFADNGPIPMCEFQSYYGRLHVHPWASHPKDIPDMTVVFRDAAKGNYLDLKLNGTFNTLLWHHDISNEHNPTGYTALTRLEGPDCGGDTIYANMMAAYDRLSPTMQTFLEGLQCVHSGTEQYKKSLTTAFSRREGIDTIHPVIRKHPATGRKALFISREYVRKIVGLKEQESDAILEMLFRHIETSADLHLRARWEDKTVVFYDNRMTQHTALLDFPVEQGGIRHLARVAAHAERPFI